jgi:hypothetical protein
MPKQSDTLSQRIGDLEAKVAELNQEIADLKCRVEWLEEDAKEDAEDRSAIYRTLLADLDEQFGIQNLPFALRASLDAFGDLL